MREVFTRSCTFHVPLKDEAATLRKPSDTGPVDLQIALGSSLFFSPPHPVLSPFLPFFLLPFLPLFSSLLSPLLSPFSLLLWEARQTYINISFPEGQEMKNRRCQPQLLTLIGNKNLCLYRLEAIR